jgi:hypothetical protein
VAAVAATAVSSPATDAHERFVHVAAALSVSAALIHTAAAPAHSRGYAPFAALFLLTAVAQLTWGALVWNRPRARGLLAAGMAFNVGVLAFWLLSRTAGLPFGPDAGGPYPVHIHDAFATTQELAIVFAVGLALSRGLGAERFVPVIVPLWVLAAFGGLTAVTGPHP